MTSAEIMTNDEFLKVLWVEIGPTMEDFEKQKNKKRENNVMYLAIFCEGLVNFQSFTLDSIDTLRSLPPNISRAIADKWADNLIHIVEMGDGEWHEQWSFTNLNYHNLPASKENSDRHLLRTLTEDVADLPGARVFMIWRYSLFGSETQEIYMWRNSEEQLFN